MLVRVIYKGEFKVRGSFKKAPKRIVRVGEKRIKAKGLHSNGGERIELSHGFQKEEKVKRING